MPLRGEKTRPAGCILQLRAERMCSQLYKQEVDYGKGIGE